MQEPCITNMAKKKAFALRIDPDILAAIEKWAADEFRSSNGQIEWILSNALKKEGRLKKMNPEQNEDRKR
jgi:hypothetical protein